jgi:predicted nucleic acid-binding protein
VVLVSFTDDMSFAIMHREGIKQVFGFDRLFEYAGFRLWSGRRPQASPGSAEILHTGL